jgi:two-component system response regulator HydG
MKKLKIFVVDDDVDFAESLVETLESRGHQVEMAHSGEEAVTRFQETDFDLAFMDVKLPGMNGVESFLEIRKLKPDSKVMMTGYSMQELLQQAIDHGALGVLDKPLDMSKVLKTVESAFPDGIILLADDDPDFVESTQTALENAGYRVLVARDGEEAIQSVQENDIDLLLLDLCMPVLNGLEVYLELKGRGKQLPTIIVTGYVNDEMASVRDIQELSKGQCFTKPFDPQALLDSIETMINE